jgi:acetylglutamate kinase
MEPEIIQRFLESVGQKADVDLYLRLFRAQKKESFAIISADAGIVKNALDPFHFDLRILTGLGLTPVVLLGLDDGREADRQAQRVQEWLLEDAVPAERIASGPDMPAPVIESVRRNLQAGAVPLVSLEEAKATTTEGRFRLLAAMAEALETRKVVFLSRRAGLERQGVGLIQGVNLSSDYDSLLTGGALSRRQASLLRQVKQLIDRVPHRMSVAVVNPLQLLRELFTVSGAGTLIRRGSRVESHSGFAGLDRARLQLLIQSAFGRRLLDTFWDRPVARVYVEEGYRGAAVLSQTPIAMYLSKFAVERQAQGEGIGGDLWTVITRDYPSFFWRSRPSNAITAWYAKQCDGLARFSDWHVFWRGLPPESIEPAIRHALAAPLDFVDGVR